MVPDKGGKLVNGLVNGLGSKRTVNEMVNFSKRKRGMFNNNEIMNPAPKVNGKVKNTVSFTTPPIGVVNSKRKKIFYRMGNEVFQR